MHRRGERIEPTVTINAVVWRLAEMTLLGRETPELPMEVLFSDTAIGVLKDVARSNRLSFPENLGAAVPTMAMIAGYLNRKKVHHRLVKTSGGAASKLSGCRELMNWLCKC